MFWKSSARSLPMSLPIQLAGFVLLSTTFIVGKVYFPWEAEKTVLYWAAWMALAVFIVFGAPARALLERLRFQRVIKSAFKETGSDRGALIAAAGAIRLCDEMRAIEVLKRLPPCARNAPGENTRRWVATLAGVHWLARQTPFTTLPIKNETYPQLHALMHCHAILRAPLRPKALDEELERVRSVELDAYAAAHIALVDELIRSLSDATAPFSSRAAELLAMLTGRSHLLHAHERFNAWWQELRPRYVHGGGALLAGVRLMQRGAFPQAAQLLERFARDGMLSQEADTLRRAARFLALFSQPQWHMTSDDIPRYFAEGMFYQWGEMGVFRYPNADLAEVVACCKRGQIYLDAKRRLIEDALDVWDDFGDDLAEPMTLLLRRLMEEGGRNPSARSEFWRLKWEIRKRDFDREVRLLMRGIVCASKEDWSGGLKCFSEVAALNTAASLPLVNTVALLLKSNQKAQARALIERIQVLYPKDGQALVSMGRLLAIHAEDAAESEKLFVKALSLINPPTEALSCLGEVKMLAGSFAESQFYFEQARQLDPAQPGPKLGLARVFVEMRRFKDAIEVLKEVARDGPTEARDVAYYMLYRTHREAGDDRESLKYLQMIPARFFNDPDTIDDIAVHLESEKMYAKAREFAERAMLLRTYGKGRDDNPDALSAM